jgi:uncharacterized protein (TIGR02996 family)
MPKGCFMTHPEYLNAILDNPAADDPRLAYADWLDEHCDPRGEFIRVQCRLAANKTDKEKCFFELEVREGELLHEYAPAWAEPISGMVDWWAFHRGFVEEIGTKADRFLANVDSLFRREPIREIHFSDAGTHVEQLADCRHVGRAPFLDFSGNRLGDAGINRLAGSSNLAGIRGLNLSSTGIGDDGALALAGAGQLANLEELYLSNNRIGDVGAGALAGASQLGRLNALFLNDNNFSREGRRILNRRFGKRVHF